MCQRRKQSKFSPFYVENTRGTRSKMAKQYTAGGDLLQSKKSG